jgi:chemotaxis protein CheX
MKPSGELLEDSHKREGWVPLLEIAAREVFDLMLNCRLTVPELVMREPSEIVATVKLSGQIQGLLSISCTAEAAALMASKMLGIDVHKVGPEAGDAVGEICNMIAGNFKDKITGLGDACKLSVPTVICGKDFGPHSPPDANGLEVRLLFEGLPLTISLQLHS